MPVLLYIHGGGFTYGSKSSPGDPSTLFSRSLANGGSGAIVIMMNYRLGMFGWLVGGGVTPNLGRPRNNHGVHDANRVYRH